MHLRGRRALVAAAILSSALGARAESLSTGAAATVKRERSLASLHLVFVAPAQDTSQEIGLLGVNGPIEVGEEYDIVDQAGFATLVRVASVKKTDEKCPGYPYLVASARPLAAARAANTYRAIALGPVHSADTNAKLLNPEDQLVGAAPPPGWAPSLMYLVDRDGDGVGDLARYLFDCATGPRQSFHGADLMCIEDFAREHGSWRSLGRVRFGCK